MKMCGMQKHPLTFKWPLGSFHNVLSKSFLFIAKFCPPFGLPTLVFILCFGLSSFGVQVHWIVTKTPQFVDKFHSPFSKGVQGSFQLMPLPPMTYLRSWGSYGPSHYLSIFQDCHPFLLETIRTCNSRMFPFQGHDYLRTQPSFHFA